MDIHEQPPDCNDDLGIIRGQPVEDCGHPDREEHDSYRLPTDFRTFRISPAIPGLSLVKRTITWARGWHLIPVRFAQRLVDLSKCWEA